MYKIKLKKEPDLSAKHSAFIYQQTAVDCLGDLQYAAIFHEQGLGKSKIAIDLALKWLASEEIDTALFVPKKALINNWVEELGLHSHVRPYVFTNSSSRYGFLTPARIMVAHYEFIKSHEERFKYFLKTRNVAVFLDESTKIKNPNSKITQSFFNLASLFAKRVIITGTPIANRPYDIWSQVFFLDEGLSLGTDFEEFKNEVELSNALYDSKDAQTDYVNGLRSIYPRISTFTVRETKDSGIVTLPDKDITNVECDWEDEQYDMYCNAIEESSLLIQTSGDIIRDDIDNVLKKLLRLLQISSNPNILNSNYTKSPGKFVVLQALVNEIVNKGEKGIIWTSYVDNCDWLAKRLNEYGVCKVHGKMDIDRRNASIDRFKADKNINFLVATYGAAKEGLTLTVANHSINYDRSFSLDDYLQSQDRIHRISQEKKCFVYNLVLPNSIDVWIEALITAKHASAQYLLNDITAEEYEDKMNYEFGEILENIFNMKG